MYLMMDLLAYRQDCSVEAAQVYEIETSLLPNVISLAKVSEDLSANLWRYLLHRPWVATADFANELIVEYVHPRVRRRSCRVVLQPSSDSRAKRAVNIKVPT